jgi:hypothetical protein
LIATLTKKGRASQALLIIGIVCNTASLISLAFVAGTFMPSAAASAETLIPWALAVSIAVHAGFSDHKELVRSALWPMTALTGLCTWLTIAADSKGSLIVALAPTNPAFWVVIFHIFDSLTYAALFAAGWYAFAYYRGKQPAAFFRNYVIAAFVLYSVAQIAGGYWCYLGWSVPFHVGSERHWRSAALWLFLTLNLHLDLAAGWSLRRRSGVIWGAFAPVLYLRYAPVVLPFLKR